MPDFLGKIKQASTQFLVFKKEVESLRARSKKVRDDAIAQDTEQKVAAARRRVQEVSEEL